MYIEDRLRLIEERLARLESGHQSKKKGAVSELEDISDMLSHVNHSLQREWLKMYPPSFIKEHLRNAHAWAIANPSRAPRSQYGRFYNSWLQRQWKSQPQLSSAVLGVEL
jgi:hypothetical protein